MVTLRIVKRLDDFVNKSIFNEMNVRYKILNE
jgi:hypothetical protein